MKEECPKCGSIDWKIDKRFSDSWVEGDNKVMAICVCGHSWKTSIWASKKLGLPNQFTSSIIDNLIGFKSEMERKDQEIATLKGFLEQIRSYVPSDSSCRSIPMSNIVSVLKKAFSESDEEDNG